MCSSRTVKHERQREKERDRAREKERDGGMMNAERCACRGKGVRKRRTKDAGEGEDCEEAERSVYAIRSPPKSRPIVSLSSCVPRGAA